MVWAVAEMSSCAVINTDFNVNWKIGYQQLAPHQEKIMEFYKGKENFTDFLEIMLGYFKDKGITF